MASSYLKPSAITAEALRILHNMCPFTQNIDKQHDRETTFGGQKRGSTLRIRLPNKYTVRRTWAINVQDTTEQSVSLVIGQIFGADMMFSDSDLALEINEFSRRFIEPAISVIASSIDSYNFTQAYQATWNSVGTPGTTPNNQLPWLLAGAKLNDNAIPTRMRKAVINPDAQAYTVSGLASLFNSSKEVSKQYVDGAMGTALGFDWFMSQNVPNHTTGNSADDASILVDEPAGTNLVEGTTTIHVDGLDSATGTFKAGDVFTMGSVYAVNPETKVSTGKLQQFVVSADATAAGSEVDLTFTPAIYSTGALQNVDALPADGAAVTVWGGASTAYPQNLCYHPDAYTFATANLEMPSDVTFKGQMSIDGINMRILRQYDINSSNYPCRIDVFAGFLAQRPEMGTRVWG